MTFNAVARRYFFSGSSLGLARRCPASTVLPHARWLSPPADMGSALHEHMHDRVRLGLEAALQRLPEVAKRWELGEEETRIFFARARAFKYMPPEGAIAEYPLALMMDGSVEPCVGARGEYEVPDNALMPATLDCMWAEPYPLRMVRGVPRCPRDSVLWVVDWKSGSDENPDPVEYNWQACSTALMAARYTGARYVMPAICYWRAGEGEWDTFDKALPVEELEWVEQGIRETHVACLKQQALVNSGQPVEPIQGATHCTHCGARTRCPAKVGMIRSVISGDLSVVGLSAPLSDQHRLQLAAILPQLDRFSRAAKELLKADVDTAGPVRLGDGREWGPHEVEEDVIDPDLGVSILAEEVGEEAARAAVTVKLSKEAVKDAIRASHEERGIVRQMAKAERVFYGKAKEKGALTKRTVVKYEAHKVQPALPVDVEDAEIESE